MIDGIASISGSSCRCAEDGLTELRYRQVLANLPNMSVLSFDADLRLQVAAGEVLDRIGYQPEAMIGELLSDALPAAVMTRLEKPYRAALAGEHSDLEYSSPINGRQYRMRVRPVLDAQGSVIGGLALSEDVSEDKARQAQLEHLHQLSRMGAGWYDAASGWTFDDELMNLLGVATADEVATAVYRLVLPADRARTRAGFREVLAAGGRASLQYRIRHGDTGELRHLNGTCEAVVDKDGTLLRAVMTHTDVTEAVNARESAESARAATAQARTALLRQVSDAMVTDPGSLTGMLQRITDIAASAAGDGAVLRVLTPDGLAVESDLIAHSDERTKKRIATFLQRRAQPFDRGVGLPGAVLASGRLLTSIGNADWKAELSEHIGAEHIPADVEQFVFAPVRHEDRILGFLHVFRSDAEFPYERGDDDLVQVLADRIGGAIAESRARQLAEREVQAGIAVRERLAALSKEQQELLDYITDVEQRERTLLAEAVHDDPMQLIVAAIMGMDNLGGTVPADQQQELDRLAGMLESSVGKLRTLIVALTPPDLNDGLGVALRSLADGIFIGTHTRLTVTGPAHVGLPLPTKATAYRILREALVNVRKHAHARNVTLDVTENDASVVVQLTDDGVGAESLDAGPGHMGLTTMRVRAENEGGVLDIRSTPGRGTIVMLSLPERLSRDRPAGR